MNSLRKMWDDTKYIDILIMGISGEKGDKKAEKHIWRNMVEMSQIWWKTAMYRPKKLSKTQEG